MGKLNKTHPNPQMSDKLIKLIQSQEKKKTHKREDSKNWIDLLDQLANKPVEEENQGDMEEAPLSPDPRFNHNSKLVTGICKMQTEDEIEKERERLRKQFMVNRAETVLLKEKHGVELTPVNYN